MNCASTSGGVRIIGGRPPFSVDRSEVMPTTKASCEPTPPGPSTWHQSGMSMRSWGAGNFQFRWDMKNEMLWLDIKYPYSGYMIYVFLTIILCWILMDMKVYDIYIRCKWNHIILRYFILWYVMLYWIQFGDSSYQRDMSEDCMGCGRLLNGQR